LEILVLHRPRAKQYNDEDASIIIEIRDNYPKEQNKHKRTLINVLWQPDRAKEKKQQKNVSHL